MTHASQVPSKTSVKFEEDKLRIFVSQMHLSFLFLL